MLMGVIGVRVTRSLLIGVLFFLMSPFWRSGRMGLIG